MVQLSNQVSSSDKLKSQQLLLSCENSVASLFNLPTKEVSKTQETLSGDEMITLITSVAIDSSSVFKILDSLPVTRDTRIKTITRRDENRLVKNNFTMREGCIRAELNSEDKTFYIIQYPDATYTCTTAENVTLL